MDLTTSDDYRPNNTNTKGTNRIIVLAAAPGKEPTANADKSLVTGNNRLHAIMDKENCMWFLKYEHGILPQPFQQKFTSYSKMIKFLTEYYGKRNIVIKEVLD